MSGSRPTPAEQHLGDRLSALVDGELGHEARDRVLAHLATCAKCKSEADEQRRLKNVFAEAAPPPPSESFLARLQMLPAGGDGDGGSPLSGGFGGRLGGTAGGSGLPGDPSDSRDFADFGVFGSGDSFGYVPSGPHGGALTPSEGRGLLGGGRGTSGGRGFLGDRGFLSGRGFLGDRGALGDRGFLGGGRDLSGGADERPDGEERTTDDTDDQHDRGVRRDRGFRIHDVRRHEAERSASRGMRFAFVAAGAVSLAAIALGGVTNGMPVETADARGGSGAGSNVTPLRTPAGTVPTPEAQRRRGAVGPLLGQGQQSLGDMPVAPTEISAPLLPGVPAPAGQDRRSVHPLTAPVLAGAAVMSPLIRPLTDAPPLQLTDWSPASELAGPGLLTAPDTTSSPTPTSPVLR
ncbi:zf-HC2 domain-containing protein [Streptomyces caniscabiei]|uniref:Zf-HC2 domain-containing protein n=1 Tax=Streptomyces caniscabiei TaxID=2746961 RepID=A0ABU4N3X1_9ACTN|nr:zf-HC2 domain-containing protein [Streptomyces caniscabiei]MBE4740993.1 zf-HC2 domain-containing protein [Streptomyces caniscabiei]MBE4759950.1 zf-HC2 domain-containing protein [Streptomyces caniscabiei]MBE4774061.1 zf-HC2 domain-containing protein [Streptomyces caniscabiei]MBE4789285.1 zf-HC2 domain-containing protein [Streptomyces caniscabiei]MBE4794525.1 zf-HC2 domain-containing protein [Streptomyces caniscabiei]